MVLNMIISNFCVDYALLSIVISAGKYLRYVKGLTL